MACDTKLRSGQTLAQRGVAVKSALAKLEAALKAKKASVVIGANGAVAFKGWNAGERDDVSDVCALRILQAQGSWELRQAIAKAEAISGRKVNMMAVVSGVHSHDGGKTWGPGHK